MSVKVLRGNTVFINEVFAIGRGLFSVFSHSLVQVPGSIASVNSSCALSPGNYTGHLLVFSVLGVGALANLVCPGGQALANPGGTPKNLSTFIGMFS